MAARGPDASPFQMTRSLPALAVALAVAGAARAEPLPAFAPPAEASAVRETRWYGWQVILADAGASALAMATMGTRSVAAAAVPFGMWLLGGPVIHLAHGSPGDALKSFLFRGVPIGIGAAVALSMRPQQCYEGCAAMVPLALGSIVSLAGAIADYTVLSTETVERPTLSIAPAVPLDRRGSGVALALRF